MVQYVDKPSRGKVKKEKNGHYSVSVVTSRVNEGRPAIKNVKMGKEDFEKAKGKYGERKIALPRFFKSQIVADLYDERTFVEDNVYYLLESSTRVDKCIDINLINAFLNSRIISLIDYVRRGLDRINSLGFRALDAEKFASMHVPDLDESGQKKLIKLYQSVKNHINHADDPDFFQKQSRVNVSRMKKIIDFENFIAESLNIHISKKELKKILEWWASHRMNFGEESLLDMESAS